MPKPPRKQPDQTIPPKTAVRFSDLKKGERFSACGEHWVKQATDWAKHATDPDRGQLFYAQASVLRVAGQ